MPIDPKLWDLSGKTALVTGASRGIGEATALLLASCGAHVVVSSRREDACAEVVGKIQAAGGTATAVAAHIGEQGSMDRLFGVLNERGLGLDVLVNNAATNPYFGSMIEMGMGAFDKTVEVNIRGYFYATVQAAKIIQSHPASSGFENSTYYGLNAFWFMDASGRSIPVRWSLAPVQPFVPANTTGPTRPDNNYLFDALIAGILQQPLQWHLIITIGQANDPTNDATIPWPDAREQVDVGTLTLDHVESEETSPARDINFDPLVLPEGMAPSDDPLLSARSAVYSQSFTRRAGEKKLPSAVTPSEVRN